MKKLCLILVIVLLIGMTGCGELPVVTTFETKAPIAGNRKPVDLMEGIRQNDLPATDLSAGTLPAVTFGLKLFQSSLTEGQNTLISPASVLYALAMTANGAQGKTLTQLEDLFGMDLEELNDYCRTWMAQQGKQLKLANSIWYSSEDTLSLEKDFLQTNADHYGADLFSLPFDDGACEAINSWVSQHTDGMIPRILDRIPQEAVIYLINALAFQDAWESDYKEHQIRKRDFYVTNLMDSYTVQVDMMYSDEQLYLEDEQATGFVKYFAGREYAFVALLPKEGVTVEDYVKGLTGESLSALLGNPVQIHVNAGLPRFKTESTVQMNEILTSLGVTDAFDPGKADLSQMGTAQQGPLYVSSVLHKTFMQVDAQGAKAGAATVVEIAPGAAMPGEVEEKTVILDRPFVYMLVDCENNVPFFMGTMHQPDTWNFTAGNG